jgi:Fe-S cluster assembly iron-binding protein IscA
MGMTLDESIEDLDKLESNGVTAFIDPKVLVYLEQFGAINIDYVSHNGQSGYMVKVGAASCGPDSGNEGGCSGCG